MSKIINYAVLNNLKRLLSFLDGWAIVLVPENKSEEGVEVDKDKKEEFDNSNNLELDINRYIQTLKNNTKSTELNFKNYANWRGEMNMVVWVNHCKDHFDISKLEKYEKKKVVLILTYKQYTYLLNNLPKELEWIKAVRFGEESEGFCLTNI